MILAIVALESGPEVRVMGLLEFVTAAVTRDLTLQQAGIDRNLAVVRSKAARSGFWPQLRPTFGVTEDTGGARSSDYGAQLNWDTGWGSRPRRGWVLVDA